MRPMVPLTQNPNRIAAAPCGLRDFAVIACCSSTPHPLLGVIVMCPSQCAMVREAVHLIGIYLRPFLL
ncbi:hypothetical protein BIFGAL_03410 [Bifidobacterium gallicum DSM 20093 = LMG 11596]|uniref:Uncharacterized protein n=1 Tax=Bifidobacterium gallicum DSM 20093 = LMG 11596 TaxID=561180 RepID=D1NU89_9BIFI|nr:hypothetical protein BIFGAL_03410 [Bifidobacterium gallicum DSM 20093 = LMG 11596]